MKKDILHKKWYLSSQIWPALTGWVKFLFHPVSKAMSNLKFFCKITIRVPQEDTRSQYLVNTHNNVIHLLLGDDYFVISEIKKIYKITHLLQNNLLLADICRIF